MFEFTSFPENTKTTTNYSTTLDKTDWKLKKKKKRKDIPPRSTAFRLICKRCTQDSTQSDNIYLNSQKKGLLECMSKYFKLGNPL